MSNERKNGCFAVAYDRISAIIEELNTHEVVHYLIYCCGRRGTQTTTRWSENALNTYLGVPARKSASSEQRLIDTGHVVKLQDGKRPEFEIASSETDEHLWLPTTFVTGVGS